MLYPVIIRYPDRIHELHPFHLVSIFFFSSALEEENTLNSIRILPTGSIVDNAQSPELRTYLAGQIARAATVFNIDEVVVFCETTSKSGVGKTSVDGEFKGASKSSDPNVFLARILQYLETPQ